MKSFRDKEKVDILLNQIKKEAVRQSYIIMEVCGTHTVAISKWGLRNLLPKNIRLISGPGCPVCVTSQGETDLIFQLLEKYDIALAVYGDMMKVPGSKGENLLYLRGKGKRINIVGSVLDVLDLSKSFNEEIVFVSIGFETTTPQTAYLIMKAKEIRIKNLSVLLFNKTMPEILNLLLSDKNLNIDGFIAPGHVSAVTGEELYLPIIKAKKAAVITGFEPVEILNGILEIIRQVNRGDYKVENCYKRVVSGKKNIKAYTLMDEVFEICDAVWRGIGLIKGSGLRIKKSYEEYDAFKRYGLTPEGFSEREGCRCGDVLKGYLKPTECKLFGNICTPENPYGPCMVSAEGTCAAYYMFGEDNG